MFHPMAGPDDEGLPCIEIAGILVFAHLDPDLRAVRVTLHLDTPDHRLVFHGQRVPLHVEVEDTTLYSTSTPAPAARATAPPPQQQRQRVRRRRRLTRRAQQPGRD
ncbi:hypothetical protein [Streptomyces sp. NPDC058739]|uniref:hypothetical protein n=1 Tax=Streptomyces sp. NPDC058739 TaxID=3346618 RepID=UPI0036AE2151